MKKAQTSIQVSVVVTFVAVFALSKFYPAAGQAVKRQPAKRIAVTKSAKYTEFPHSAKAHQMECGKCHKFPSENWNKVWTGSAAFPDITDYPKHQSCLGCHKQQFFKGTPPKICSICHTNPSPGDSSRHPYPNPREIFDQSPKGKTAESDFVVGFPHDKHIEIVSAIGTQPAFINAAFVKKTGFIAGEESCAVCHKTMAPQGKSADEYLTKPPADLGDAFWLKKGTFKSSPIGHTVCFTCHTADTGILPVPETCSACRHLKPPQPASDFDPELAAKMMVEDKVMKDAWRIRHSAGKFGHEFFAHVDLSCATCHNVSAMNTADPSTIKVPIAACATCHATPTSDDGGALNYEMDQRKANASFQCTKCHITFGKLGVTRSHIEAIKAAAAPAPTSK